MFPYMFAAVIGMVTDTRQERDPLCPTQLIPHSCPPPPPPYQERVVPCLSNKVSGLGPWSFRSVRL